MEEKMEKTIQKMRKIQKKKMHNYLLRQLTEAVAQNNFAKVEELLKNGATINGKDCFGMTPLEYAVRNGYVKMMEYLIQAGANIDTKDEDGYTLLMRVIQGFKYSVGFPMVKILLKNGADVSIIGNGGMSVLSLARIFEPRYIGILKRYGAVF